RAAVADAVARAVVAGGDADGHVERSRIRERIVERGLRLFRPRALRAAPADRDYGGRVRPVVDGRRDGVDDALIRVPREVDGDARARRDRADDLDVEQHLAVGAAGVARRAVR